jgi:hypothetical protein
MSYCALIQCVGCSALKVDGECTYLREVKVMYQCESGAKVLGIEIEP